MKYLFLSLPVFISYSIFVYFFLHKVTHIRFMIFPLVIFNIYCGFWLCLISIGGAILWAMIPTIIFLLVALVFSFINGLLKDIKDRSK